MKSKKWVLNISYRTKHNACIVHKKGILVYWSLVLLFFSPSLFSAVLVLLFICCLVGIIWNETSVRLKLFYTESCSVESKTVLLCKLITLIFYNFRFVFVLLHLSPSVYLFLLSLPLWMSTSLTLSLRDFTCLNTCLSSSLFFFSLSLSPVVMCLTAR